MKKKTKLTLPKDFIEFKNLYLVINRTTIPLNNNLNINLELPQRAVITNRFNQKEANGKINRRKKRIT